MVLQDKFNYHQAEFYSELCKFISTYMEYDGLTVEASRGANNNMVLTISVKKFKPTSRPLT